MLVFESEDIPDTALLYYRVHTCYVDKITGEIHPGCFRDPAKPDSNGKMSTDWNEYSTPNSTRLANGQEKAQEYGVIGLPVARVRAVRALSVVHTPLDSNRAHTDVQGLAYDNKPLLTQQRYDLHDIGCREWLIAPNAPVQSGI